MAIILAVFMAIVALDTMRKRARLRQMADSPLSKASPEQFQEWRGYETLALKRLMIGCKIFFFVCVPLSLVLPQLTSPELQRGVMLVILAGLLGVVVFAALHLQPAIKARKLRKQYHILFV